MLGLVPDLGKDGGKGNKLRLVRQIDNTVYLLLPQEFGGALEPGTDCVVMLFVGVERQIEQRLARGADGRPVAFLLAWVGDCGESQFLGV